MALSTNVYSRFRTTRTVLQDGEEVWGTWNRPNLLKGEIPQNQRAVIKVGSDRAGRPDLISLDVYGTTKLDWLLIAANNATDVFNWPRSGTVIIVPPADIVLGDVL